MVWPSGRTALRWVYSRWGRQMILHVRSGFQDNGKIMWIWSFSKETRPLDLGKANDRYFINIAGGGSLTELTYEVPSRLKTMIRRLAYYMKGIEKMASLSPQELIIRANGQEEIHDEFMLFLIANTNSVGGFEKLAPGATIDDGLFDVIGVRKCNLADMIRLVTLAPRRASE